jgi:NTE family protein
MRAFTVFSLFRIWLVLCVVMSAPEKGLFGESVSVRPKIGLVLGGGGARGMAHTGVLKVLRDLRIPIDYIAGTSMGALVGGLYAAGYSPEEIEQIFSRVDWNDIFRDSPPRSQASFRSKEDAQKYLFGAEVGLRKDRVSMSRGFISGQKLSTMLQTNTLQIPDPLNFNDLSIPFRAVATDLESGEMVILSQGSLAQAIRASISVPGMFSPVEIDGRVLVDGGIVCNLPVEVVKKMGADIVIAVQVGAPLAKRDTLTSALNVSLQVMDIMILQNVKKQSSLLTEKDFFISPVFEKISFQDFDKWKEIGAIGEEAAYRMKDLLAELSLSEESYQEWVAAQKIFDTVDAVVEEVRVKSPGRISPKVVSARVSQEPGARIEREVLYEDLGRIYDLGWFSSVDFRFLGAGEKRILVIEPKEKPWGPDYIRFGFNLSDDFAGGGRYNFLTGIMMTEMNRLGGEWRNELQIGAIRRVRSEFYQPLLPSGQIFISPFAEGAGTYYDVYEGYDLVARYKKSQISTGVEAGFQWEPYSRIKVGIRRDSIDARVEIGSPLFVRHNDTRILYFANYLYDRLDNVRVPRQGFRMEYGIDMARKGRNIPSYDKVSFSFLKPFSWRRHTAIVGLSGGGNTGNEIPFFDQFSLGGLFHLSGYAPEQWRGQFFGLAKIIYLYRVSELSLPLRLSLGGSIEAGNVWQRRDDISLENLKHSGSVIGSVDTVLGTLFIGYGFGGNSSGVLYFSLGQTF